MKISHGPYTIRSESKRGLNRLSFDMMDIHSKNMMHYSVAIKDRASNCKDGNDKIISIPCRDVSTFAIFGKARDLSR